MQAENKTSEKIHTKTFLQKGKAFRQDMPANDELNARRGKSALFSDKSSSTNCSSDEDAGSIRKSKMHRILDVTLQPFFLGMSLSIGLGTGLLLVDRICKIR